MRANVFRFTLNSRHRQAAPDYCRSGIHGSADRQLHRGACFCLIALPRNWISEKIGRWGAPMISTLKVQTLETDLIEKIKAAIKKCGGKGQANVSQEAQEADETRLVDQLVGIISFLEERPQQPPRVLANLEIGQASLNSSAFSRDPSWPWADAWAQAAYCGRLRPASRAARPWSSRVPAWVVAIVS
jgi:hypothetical protein